MSQQQVRRHRAGRERRKDQEPVRETYYDPQVRAARKARERNSGR